MVPFWIPIVIRHLMHPKAIIVLTTTLVGLRVGVGEVGVWGLGFRG